VRSDRRRALQIQHGKTRRLAGTVVAVIPRRRCRGGLDQAGVVRGHQLVHVLAQVVPHVPPVSHLVSLRCAVTGTVGVTAGAVSADDLDTGVCPEPVGEPLGVPAVQDVHRSIPIAEVDQHRPIISSATPREFIDTKHRHRTDRRIRQVADPAQQRRAADRHTQRGSQPRPGPPGQSNRDGRQSIPQSGAALRVPLGQTRNLLGERARPAVIPIAEEPTRRQPQHRRLTGDRQIRQVTAIAAVHPR
jgi:hypothetical protein